MTESGATVPWFIDPSLWTVEMKKWSTLEFVKRTGLSSKECTLITLILLFVLSRHQSLYP